MIRAIINAIKRVFSNKYISWGEYKALISALDLFYFQQNVREENIKNSLSY